MYKIDIEEFKSAKILKYLFDCYIYYEGLTTKSRVFLKDKQQNNFNNKRLVSTPEITTSPLLLPTRMSSVQTHLLGNKLIDLFPKFEK